MQIIENKTHFHNDEIISISQRENNNKRKYLIVNPLQAKHIPVSPEKSLKLFRELGDLAKQKYNNEKVLIIGFAETATAIGISVAEAFGKDTIYINTTREDINEKYKVADFSEEHSHATEQKLFCYDWNNVIADVERIIFVEDEVSTGKTILNFVKVLKEGSIINKKLMFSVVSIINAMNKEAINIFDNNNIDYIYLLKINSQDIENKSNNIYLDKVDELKCYEMDFEKNIDIKSIQGKKDTRIGVTIKEYIDCCNCLSDNIIDSFLNNEFYKKNILILGTEECMYPAIKTAEIILKSCFASSVNTHSTTRSPIMAFNDNNYIINSKYAVRSLYSNERKTYIYNLKKYDKALVITDSNYDICYGASDLYNAIHTAGCNDITFIRWVD